jgi:hypothetical protein
VSLTRERAAGLIWRQPVGKGAPDNVFKVRASLQSIPSSRLLSNVGSQCSARFQNRGFASFQCKRNIEMTPLCKIEVTHPRVLGSREVRRGGVVDGQTGVQPS